MRKVWIIPIAIIISFGLFSDIYGATYNAIMISANLPSSVRLGGVFAKTCPATEFMTGIPVNGSITCAVP
jgi:hypothetical protein